MNLRCVLFYIIRYGTKLYNEINSLYVMRFLPVLPYEAYSFITFGQ